jgi:hypothetical protein
LDVHRGQATRDTPAARVIISHCRHRHPAGSSAPLVPRQGRGLPAPSWSGQDHCSLKRIRLLISLPPAWRMRARGAPCRRRHALAAGPWLSPSGRSISQHAAFFAQVIMFRPRDGDRRGELSQVPKTPFRGTPPQDSRSPRQSANLFPCYTRNPTARGLAHTITRHARAGGEPHGQ